MLMFSVDDDVLVCALLLFSVVFYLFFFNVGYEVVTSAARL